MAVGSVDEDDNVEKRYLERANGGQASGPTEADCGQLRKEGQGRPRKEIVERI